MRKIITLLLLIFPFIASAQTDSTKQQEPEEKPVFMAVERSPEFYPGGNDGLKKFLQNNLVYPESAKKDKKQGIVYVEFIVETDSTLSRVEVIRIFDEECGKEAVRVVKMMRFTPGYQRNKPVRVKYRLPVRFKLY